jgi:tellurite resistance protein TerC
MVYVFGAFSIYTGVRMACHSNEEVHPERNPVLRLLRRLLPMTDGYRGQRFLVCERGRLMATPLLAV